MNEKALKPAVNRMVERIGVPLTRLLLLELPFREWLCFCEPSRRHQISPTQNGCLFSSCRMCQSRIFWSDIEAFTASDGVCRHDPPPMPTKKKGWSTTWCAECGVRRFFPSRYFLEAGGDPEDLPPALREKL